jgi:putative DNA primase/helicase
MNFDELVAYRNQERERGNILVLPSSAESSKEPGPPRLQPLGVTDFLKLDIKPREMLLGPILPQKGLVMLYGTRGTGKTMVALGLAYALATGTGFLKWRADKPRKVLLVDGEMPAAALQERLSWYAVGTNADPGDNLKILCGDLIELGGVGNVGDPKVQAELEPRRDRPGSMC